MMANTLCIDLLLLMCVTNITDLKKMLLVIQNPHAVIYIFVSQH